MTHHHTSAEASFFAAHTVAMFMVLIVAIAVVAIILAAIWQPWDRGTTGEREGGGAIDINIGGGEGGGSSDEGEGGEAPANYLPLGNGLWVTV